MQQPEAPGEQAGTWSGESFPQSLGRGFPHVSKQQAWRSDMGWGGCFLRHPRDGLSSVYHPKDTGDADAQALYLGMALPSIKVEQF